MTRSAMSKIAIFIMNIQTLALIHETQAVLIQRNCLKQKNTKVKNVKQIELEILIETCLQILLTLEHNKILLTVKYF